MNRFHPRVLAATTIVVAAACSDATGPAQDATLADAFSTVLLGFNNVESSFAGGREAGLAAWSPGGGRREAQSGELCAGRAGWVIPGWHRIRPRSHQSIGVQRLHVRVGIRRRRVRSRGTQWPHRESLGCFTDGSGNVQSAYDSATTNTLNVRVAVKRYHHAPERHNQGGRARERPHGRGTRVRQHRADRERHFGGNREHDRHERRRRTYGAARHGRHHHQRHHPGIYGFEALPDLRNGRALHACHAHIRWRITHDVYSSRGGDVRRLRHCNRRDHAGYRFSLRGVDRNSQH
jgi:hypothetical protein